MISSSLRRMNKKSKPQNQMETAEQARQRRSAFDGYGSVVTIEDAKRWKDMSPGEKIVYGTKQTSYAGVVLTGLGLTGNAFRTRINNIK